MWHSSRAFFLLMWHLCTCFFNPKHSFDKNALIHNLPIPALLLLGFRSCGFPNTVDQSLFGVFPSIKEPPSTSQEMTLSKVVILKKKDQNAHENCIANAMFTHLVFLLMARAMSRQKGQGYGWTKKMLRVSLPIMPISCDRTLNISKHHGIKMGGA